MRKPPSDRQVAYLKRLGFKGQPPATSHEVSAAIDALVKRNRVANANELIRSRIREAKSRFIGVNDPLWLNTKTGVRHNSHCRLYRATVGQECEADEGRPCGFCGG
jgi:hypothetical protein